MLKRNAAKIIVYVDGVAASIASIIAMAGDEIIMPKGSMIMVHNPTTGCWGEAKDFIKTAETLNIVRDSMLSIYTAKTGKSSAKVAALLDAETWMTAEEAVKQGFATKLEDTQKVAASLRGTKAMFNGIGMDWSSFKNAPKLQSSGRNLDVERRKLELLSYEYSDSAPRDLDDEIRKLQMLH